jgi:hypothetical protein
VAAPVTVEIPLRQGLCLARRALEEPLPPQEQCPRLAIAFSLQARHPRGKGMTVITLEGRPRPARHVISAAVQQCTPCRAPQPPRTAHGPEVPTLMRWRARSVLHGAAAPAHPCVAATARQDRALPAGQAADEAP